MSLSGALLTFVSVFVAALLAFYLDGLRERRATQQWVKEYLGFWRDLLDSTAGEAEGNEAGVRRIESALDGWLAADGPLQPTWTDIDALNVNATVRFTPSLLGSGGRVVPAGLMRQLFLADAMAPAMSLRAGFVTTLFESEVRPLVLSQVVPLEGRDRRVVELYRGEFLGLFEQMSQYAEHIREELVRLGF
jgi:hypothetical protein